MSNLTDLFKRVDRGIFRVEQWLITLAMTVMTVTVCLDITYRALTSQKSSAFNALIHLFGLIEAESAGVNVSGDLTPLLTLLITPYLIGWAVYASQHRGEEGLMGRALRHGLFWMLGAVIGAITLYHVPSRWICAGLVALSGVTLVYTHRELLAQVPALLGILAYQAILISLSLYLPQDYIWSQELSLILLAWVAFLGASMATHQHKHIQIKAFFGLYPDRFKPYVVAYGLLLTALFAAYLTASLSVSVFGETGSFYSGERRPSTQIPGWVILFSGVVSFALVSLRSLFYAILIFRDPSEAPREEEAH